MLLHVQVYWDQSVHCVISLFESNNVFFLNVACDCLKDSCSKHVTHSLMPQIYGKLC